MDDTRVGKLIPRDTGLIFAQERNPRRHPHGFGQAEVMDTPLILRRPIWTRQVGSDISRNMSSTETIPFGAGPPHSIGKTRSTTEAMVGEVLPGDPPFIELRERFHVKGNQELPRRRLVKVLDSSLLRRLEDVRKGELVDAVIETDWDAHPFSVYLVGLSTHRKP